MRIPSILNFYCEGKGSVLESNPTMYRLNIQRLEKNKVYFIFSEQHASNFLIIDYFCHVTFSNFPNKIYTETKMFQGMRFYAVSIPIEYKETCHRIASLYKLHCTQISQTAFTGDLKIGITIPNSEKIIVVRGENFPIFCLAGVYNTYPEQKREKEIARLKEIGQALDKLGID